MNEQLPPMGWYPDPTDPAQERYWEGTRWTHNVREPQSDGQWASGLGAPRTTHQGAAPESGTDHMPRTTAGQQVRPDQVRPDQVQGQQGWAQQVWGQQVQQQASLMRPATSDGVPLATFGQRLVARLIDTVAVTVVAVPLAWPWLRRFFDIVAAEANAGTLPNQREMAEKIQGPVGAIAIIWVAVMFAYQLLMVGLTSRTLGKMAMGLQVVPLGRGREGVGWGSAFLRAVVVGFAALGDISIGITTLIACLWSLQRPRQQALQDRLARTQVISKA